MSGNWSSQAATKLIAISIQIEKAVGYIEVIINTIPTQLHHIGT